MSEPPPDEAIGCTALTKRYVDGDRRLDAVAEVTLSIPRGVLWALRGPSGSGKTTLLGLLGAMIVPTEGEVRLLGRAITGLRDRHRTALRRDAVGFVFQQLALVPRMTLRENVGLPCVPTGGPTRAEAARATALLERFGLADRAERRVARLSGGERQRAAIARALILDPPLLFLDEPTAHLDGANARTVVDTLASLRDEGRTVVTATHDPRLADDPRLDRVVDLVDGRLAG